MLFYVDSTNRAARISRTLDVGRSAPQLTGDERSQHDAPWPEVAIGPVLLMVKHVTLGETFLDKTDVMPGCSRRREDRVSDLVECWMIAQVCDRCSDFSA